MALLANNVSPGQSLNDIHVADGDIVALSTHALSHYGHFVGTDLNVSFASVPEPSTVILLGIGLASILCVSRRKALLLLA